MMGMLVTGTSSDILKLSTDDFTLYISGSSENKKFKATNNNKNIMAHLGVDTTYNYTTETINSFKVLEINNTNTMYPSFFEDGIYNLYLENNTNDKFEIYHDHKEIRDNIITRGRNTFGSFKFNGDIGYSTFKIIKNNSEVLSLTIQVFPSKLDYMDDYNEILKDINEEITSLVFDFLNKTFSSVNICDNKSQTGLEFIVILNNIYEKLERAIKRIERFPKHSVVIEYNLKNKHKSKVISTKETIKHLRKKHNSNNVVEVRKNTTLDILENQYVKFIIKRILDKIKNVKSNVKIKQGENNKYYIQLEVYEKRLTHHLNTFFRNISDINNNKSISLVFKMSSGYKECYYYYNLLSKALDISSGLYDISNKKLWNLYEIWCYIKIHSIIKELGYEAKENSIIQSTSNGLTLSLMQNKEAKCIYENDKGKRLELFYNKQYNKLPTTNQRPDTVLCLKGVGKTDRVYIFDAKYRIYVDKSGNICPMEDDINIMHRYRDSIVSKSSINNSFKYESVGAYVMFPCSDEESFKENRFYKSIEKVNIGALPMLPGSTSLMKKHLCDIINESYMEAINNNPVFDEEDDYYKFKNKNVMIVNTKDKNHFDVYKENRFYHIPKKSLSKLNIGVEYLAFYQPIDKSNSSNKFNNDFGIEYYAKIKDYYEYERGSCKELKCDNGKENDIYLRFELDELKKVGPIHRVEYGIRTLNYTTLYLLKTATTMHELYLSSRREIDVYKILKKISKDKNINLRKENDGFYIGSDFVKVLDNGDIKLNKNKVSIKDILYIN